MRAVHDVSAIRAAESALMATTAEGTLMQRAAFALAVHCVRALGRPYGARVLLLVGTGNNGGDALYAGAELSRRGAQVSAVPLDAERMHDGGRAALLRAGGRLVTAGSDRATDVDLVVDGLFGIGGRGDLDGRAAALAALTHSRATVAVDIPSGVDADTGAAGAAAVHADSTVTFGALKAGLVSGAGAERAGSVHLVDIGLGPYLPDARTQVLEAADVRALLSAPGGTDDKYTRGVVGVVAGSPEYGGAGVLATGSALVGGAGMVRYLGRSPDAIRARYPEVVVQSGSAPGDVRVQAWVVGPGLGTDDDARRLLEQVLATDVPVIVDADGITVLAQAPELARGRRAPTVITPHDREFARIADGPSDDRVGSARAAAATLGVTVLLKGNATVIADPDGAVFVNPTGTPWLGTAGSGDVLSGLLGSLLATGLPGARAAAVAAYVHGVAGQRAAAAGPPTAVDVLNNLRGAIHSVEID